MSAAICVFTHVQTCAHESMYCMCVCAQLHVLSLRVWGGKTSELIFLQMFFVSSSPFVCRLP